VHTLCTVALCFVPQTSQAHTLCTSLTQLAQQYPPSMSCSQQ
jgi:hypothetical protein